MRSQSLNLSLKFVIFQKIKYQRWHDWKIFVNSKIHTFQHPTGSRTPQNTNHQQVQQVVHVHVHVDKGRGQSRGRGGGRGGTGRGRGDVHQGGGRGGAQGVVQNRGRGNQGAASHGRGAGAQRGAATGQNRGGTQFSMKFMEVQFRSS